MISVLFELLLIVILRSRGHLTPESVLGLMYIMPATTHMPLSRSFFMQERIESRNNLSLPGLEPGTCREKKADQR